MSHMSQQDIKEHNEAMAEKPNWCVNCHAVVPDDIHFCSVECREEYDKKMDKWRQAQPQELAIEDLIHHRDSEHS